MASVSIRNSAGESRGKTVPKRIDGEAVHIASLSIQTGGRQVSTMQKSELVLKFKSEDAFEHFCVRLTENHVPFSLTGNRTIGVSRKIPTRY
jgi:hypothetical protein